MAGASRRGATSFFLVGALVTISLLMLIEEDDTNLLVKGLDLGVNDYLMTPIDGNEPPPTAAVGCTRKGNRRQAAGLASSPSAVRPLMLARKMSPVEIAGMPSCSETRTACVP